MLSHELEVTLNLAFKEAREHRHEFMTIEHLLLALIDNPASNSALRACGADLAQLRKELSEFLTENTPLLPEGDEREIQPTLGFQRVLQRAVFQVQSSGGSLSSRSISSHSSISSSSISPSKYWISTVPSASFTSTTIKSCFLLRL